MSSSATALATATSEKLLLEVVHSDLSTLKAKVQELLSQGADPNWQDSTGKTPLHLLLSGREDEPTSIDTRKLLISMKVLLDGGASVDIKDWAGRTVVHVAALMNVPSEILILIIRNCNISELSADVICELMRTENLDVNVLTIMCQLGVDLTLSDIDNIIATYHIVEKHRSIDVLLLQTLAHECPQDFNKIKDGFLFYTCIHGSKEALQALLELGASQAGRDEQSGLPALLMAASSADSEEAVAKVDVLLADGADIHITSSSGQNLCHIAAIQRNTTLLEKVLLARVSHMKRDVEGNTPLHYACAVADNNMVIMILVDAGVDVNETNYAGVSPLYHALASQHVSNITPLIKTGVSFEKSNLETGLYRDLQMLAQPEIIMASSRPLEFALCLSSFYEQMANKKPRLKEGYMELSLEMENVAISVVGGLQLKQMQRLALNGPVIENAIVTQRKRFIANEAVQQELHHIWAGDHKMNIMAYVLSLFLLFIKIIARPFVVIVIWPLIVFDIKLFGRHLSWNTLYPQAPPIIWYYAEAISYFSFICLLLAEGITFRSTDHLIEMHDLEWFIVIYILALIHNDIQTCWREGFSFYLSRTGQKRFAIALILFVVTFTVRIVAVHISSVTAFRISSYLLVTPTLLAFTRVLQYLSVHSRLGPIQGSFSKLQQESILFVTILFVYLVAFATAINNVFEATRLVNDGSNKPSSEIANGTVYKSFNETANETAINVQCIPAIDGIGEATISLFWSLFGMFELSELENCTSLEETVGKILLGVWLLIAIIILLNMLIALVTNKFQEFQDNADVQWKFSLGVAILDIQKSQRIPVPFNILHILVDFLEWLFRKQSSRKRTFTLPQVPSSLRNVQPDDIQIETFREAEQQRAMVQAVTKEDLQDVNKRVQELEVSLGYICKVMNVEDSSSRVSTINRANDGWNPYRKRLHKLSATYEEVEENPTLTEKKGLTHNKSPLCKYKMLLNKEAVSTIDGGGPSTRSEKQGQPLSQLDYSTTSQYNLIQVLTSLQLSVQQQGETIQQIRTKLASMEVQLEGHENSAGIKLHQLLQTGQDDDVV